MKTLVFYSAFLFLAISLSSKGAVGADAKIPVRMSLLGGYLATNTNFNDDVDNHGASGPAFGADFNVPFKAYNFSIGILGWLAPPVKTRDTIYTGSYLATLYAAYMAKTYDVFLGVGGALTSYTTQGPEADPNQKENFSSGTMGCGTAGSRYYFGQKGFAAGVGLSCYFCLGGSYKKSITSKSEVTTESTESSRPSQSGAIVYLFLGWDEERTLF